MDKISIDRLNMHLFDAIERLKSNNDKDVSENEKMDMWWTADYFLSFGCNFL